MGTRGDNGRLANKIALVVGGGQVPGATIGNGRATALTFAREGAKVMIADRDLEAAEETVRLVREEGAAAHAVQGDVSVEDDCRRFSDTTVEHFGRIDILMNNVGISPGDAGPRGILADAWKFILDVNLTGMLLTAKHVLPVMQRQRAGVIINMSSMISVTSDTDVYSRGGPTDCTKACRDESGMIAYKVSKTGVNGLTESLAMSQAAYGIRVNAILPGLMETPNAIEEFMAMSGMSRATLNAARDAQVPLGGKQGSAWDVANAALFLASDEAKFITGALLPVDGGQSLRRG